MLTFLHGVFCLRSMRSISNVLRSLEHVHQSTSNMTTFVSRISPITGKMEWIAQDDNYDYHQEVARSGYADMLHDTERNVMYYQALKLAIEEMKSRGKKTHVLDIGTGTGLLSMMAAACNADHITACEAFTPMADCAERCIAENGFSDRIHLIRKRSTEITVGEDGDMTERANILVTEVFDTELIGEGAIPTFKHAHENLLENDCIVVPSAANMYAQVVDSETLRRWNCFKSLMVDPNDNVSVEVPPEITDCPGAVALHDLQLDQLPQTDFTPITTPVQVFRFDYSGKSDIVKRGSNRKKVESLTNGNCDAVFMWWDLEMDTKKKIILSCAPRWSHPTPKNMQWRDHWMQAIYYPPKSLSVQAKETFSLESYHDEYSLWFNVTKTNGNNIKPSEPAMCRCGAHIACCRSRIAMINNTATQQKYVEALKQTVNSDTVCLCISDGSLLPLIAAKLGAKKVYMHSREDSLNVKMVNRFVEHNNLGSEVIQITKPIDEVTSKDIDGQKVSLLFGEPYFSASMLPWHQLHFWYSMTELHHLLSPDAVILPKKASMYCIGVDFKDLWKIRAPVGVCEGFKLQPFDNLIEKAMDIADDFVEPQPLWEYPGNAMTEIIPLLTFDLSKPLRGIKTASRKGHIPLSSTGCCNGVAVWLDFHLDDTNIVSSGLLCPPEPNQTLAWDRTHKQGVHLFKKPTSISTNQLKTSKLHYNVTFRPASGDFEFSFRVTT